MAGHPLTYKGTGANFGDYAGLRLPASYEDPAREYTAMLQGAAIIDRSHTGRVHFKGKDAQDLLNRLSTNKLEGLHPGQGAVSALTTPKGRIVDLLQLAVRDDGLFCLTSPTRAAPVIEWVDFYTFSEEITALDLSASTVLLSITGPQAGAVLERAGFHVAGLQRDDIRDGSIGGAPITIWRTLSAGADTYELQVANDYAVPVWEALVAAGATPAGLDAWEAFRVAHGAPAYGAEFGDDTNPLESRLRGAVSFAKGCYTGQEVVARLNTYQKVQRRLMSVRLSGEASAGDELLADGERAGTLSSAARIPADGSWVGLSLVNRKYAEAGRSFAVAGRNATAVLAEPAYALATEPKGLPLTPAGTDHT